MAFHGNERLEARPGRAPCGEECEIAVADIAPDQEATGPKPRFRLVIFVGIEIGEFAVGPVMKPRAFGALTGGKTLPCFWIEITGDLLSCAGDRRLTRPGAEMVVRFNPKNVTFAGSARVPSTSPTPYTASAATHEKAHRLPAHAVAYRQPGLAW
ncbi:hypothetical protein AJ87_48915 [Rhizobium yanglingense]|nr:hypothetical protein AJ87_48915 [Rhizobium yanglingense]